MTATLPTSGPGTRRRPPRPSTVRVRRRGTDAPNRPVTVILVVASLAVLVPLYVTVAMALKSPSQAAQGNAFAPPWPIDLHNFASAWRLTHFPTSFAISVAVSAGTVLGTLVLSSLAAYAIARNWDRRLFRWSFFYLLGAMFLPFPVVALPQIKLTALLSIDNPVGVTLLHIVFQLSFSVLLYSAYLRSVPAELEESARMDGASTGQIFWRIIMPLLGPMNATVGIFAFLASWNDYMLPSLITADPGLQTLPVVQSIFQSQFGTNYNIAFASYLMAMAPTVVVYLFSQRWVISGVTQGAVKQ